MLQVIVFFCCVGFFIDLIHSCKLTSFFGMAKILMLVFIAIVAPEFLLVIGLIYVVVKSKRKLMELKKQIEGPNKTEQVTHAGEVVNEMGNLFSDMVRIGKRVVK